MCFADEISFHVVQVTSQAMSFSGDVLDVFEKREMLAGEVRLSTKCRSKFEADETENGRLCLHVHMVIEGKQPPQRT